MLNKGTVLAFVRSPFQLTCLMEAIAKGNIENTVLIIESSVNRSESHSQIIRLAQGVKWKKLILLRSENKIKYHFDLLKLLLFLKFNNFSKLYIGEFKCSISHLVRLYSGVGDVILLDDGAATIDVVLNYLKNNRYTYYSGYLVDNIRYKILSTAITNRSFEYSIYSHFVFPGDVKNLRITPEKIDRKLNSNKVYYFGSKFVESNAIELIQELDYLSKIYLMLSNEYEFVYYIPHRDEKDSKLKKVGDLGFIINHLGEPAESYFLASNCLPGSIASCWSTVLWTLPNTFYFDKVFCFDNRMYLKNDNDKVKASTVYKYLERHNIKCITL